jgi:hypothetical protein
MTIFALIISTSNISSHLLIFSVTFVQAGHLTQVTTSFRVFSFVINFPLTSKTISHHFNQAFSEGVHEIGEIILNSQGFSISTYAQIHSYFWFKSSSNALVSVGGK